jgi:aspartate aminotransferase
MHNYSHAQRMQNLGEESAFEVLTKAKKLEAKGHNIIHMEIGEPDFDTPPNIVNAAKIALDEGYTHYAEAQGYFPFRQAIAKYALNYKNIITCPEEIIVTAGGKPVMFYTVLALVNPGDEVIYPDPGFPIYSSLIRFAGGIPIPISIHEENDFRIDMDELESKLTDRTKLLIINSPANPTGGILTPEDIDHIAELLKERDTYVLSDEIYDRIIYEGSTKSIASIPHMKDRTIVLDGFSKAYSMTGWRLGYGIMNKSLATKIVKYKLLLQCFFSDRRHRSVIWLSGQRRSYES